MVTSLLTSMHSTGNDHGGKHCHYSRDLGLSNLKDHCKSPLEGLSRIRSPDIFAFSIVLFTNNAIDPNKSLNRSLSTTSDIDPLSSYVPTFKSFTIHHLSGRTSRLAALPYDNFTNIQIQELTQFINANDLLTLSGVTPSSTLSPSLQYLVPNGLITLVPSLKQLNTDHRERSFSKLSRGISYNRISKPDQPHLITTLKGRKLRSHTTSSLSSSKNITPKKSRSSNHVLPSNKGDSSSDGSGEPPKPPISTINDPSCQHIHL